MVPALRPASHLRQCPLARVTVSEDRLEGHQGNAPTDKPPFPCLQPARKPALLI